MALDIFCPVVPLHFVHHREEGVDLHACCGTPVRVSHDQAEGLRSGSYVVAIPAKVRLNPESAALVLPTPTDAVTAVPSLMVLVQKGFPVPEGIAEYEGETELRWVLRTGRTDHPEGFVVDIGFDASDLIGAQRA